MKVSRSSRIDTASSHICTSPEGILASITIGEVNGIMEPQKTTWLSGALKA